MPIQVKCKDKKERKPTKTYMKREEIRDLLKCGEVRVNAVKVVGVKEKKGGVFGLLCEY